MKRNFLWIVATFLVLSVVFVGCKEKQVVLPAPPYLHITGIVTDETNQPLSSIQVTIELPEIFIQNMQENVYTYYTEANGQYNTGCLFSHSAFARSEVSWPEEISVSAKDTSGVYETQRITVPVESYARYSDGKWSNIIDAKANADFVMHKKE